MLVLIGPSASGKTEVAKILISRFRMKKLITCTTRPIRPLEVNDVDYHFLNVQQFLELKEKEEFVETTFYNNNFYGTLKKEVSDEKVVVLDPNGLHAFLSKMPDKIVSVFLEAPKEERKNRMIIRKDALDEIERRLANDDVVFDETKLGKIDYIMKSYEISLDELAEKIYHLYQNTCQSRQV
ncbi:MAG: guanylate kinase [Bacilli bacterium]